MIPAALLFAGALCVVGGICAVAFEIKTVALVPLGGLLILIGAISLPADQGGFGHSELASPPATQSVQPTSPDVPVRHIIAPQDETAFIEVVERWAAEYKNATNDVARVGMRKSRRDDLCRVLSYSLVKNWLGTLKEVGVTFNEKGTLEVVLPEMGVLATWNNAFSDVDDATLIPQGSQVFEALRTLQPGTVVRFDGSFVLSTRDCMKTKGLTEATTMREPSFVFRFSRIEAIGTAP